MPLSLQKKHHDLFYHFSYMPVQRHPFYIFLVLIALVIYGLKVLELRMNEKKYQKATKDNGHGYVLNAEQYEAAEKTMNYVEIGNDTLPMILLLHGSPGSSMDWKELMSDSLILDKAYLVAVDRPGYGYSSFGEVESSVITQAKKRKFFQLQDM